MPKPSGRKGSVKKSSLHRDGVWCVLFSMRQGESNGIEVGERTCAQPRAHQSRHAEPQWWNLNHAKYDKEATRTDLVRLEFEVTIDFCSDACKTLFKQARDMATAYGKPRLPIFVFITRSKEYYEVLEDSTIDGPHKWT